MFEMSNDGHGQQALSQYQMPIHFNEDDLTD